MFLAQSINAESMYKLRHLTIAAFSAFAMLFLLPEEVKAQVPQGINYQAVARDTSGTPLAKQTLDVVISIIDSNVFTTVYEETWNGVVTNRFGLFTIQIGRGVTVDDFTAIDWAGGGLYLNVNIDGVDMGNATELMKLRLMKKESSNYRSLILRQHILFA